MFFFCKGGAEKDSLVTIKNSPKIQGETIKVAWYIDHKNETTQEISDKLILNDDFFNTISEEEKAVLGYVATFFDQSCNWNNKQEGLKCTIIEALNLGFKCSHHHLNFLKKWFRNDPQALENLSLCTTKPNLKKRQVILKEIYITIKDKSISVLSKVASINTDKKYYSREWSIEDVFVVEDNAIKLIKTNTIHGMNK